MLQYPMHMSHLSVSQRNQVYNYVQYSYIYLLIGRVKYNRKEIVASLNTNIF